MLQEHSVSRVIHLHDPEVVESNDAALAVLGKEHWIRGVDPQLPKERINDRAVEATTALLPSGRVSK